MGIEAFGLRPSHPLCYAMLYLAVIDGLDYSIVEISEYSGSAYNIIVSYRSRRRRLWPLCPLLNSY